MKSVSEVAPDVIECPSCQLHPHRQACCRRCEDARIEKAVRAERARIKAGLDALPVEMVLGYVPSDVLAVIDSRDSTQ